MALIHWWPLDGNLNDNVGNNHLTYINNNSKLTSNNNGKTGKCYERTATGYADALRSTNKIKSLNHDHSFCFWAYVTSHSDLNTANGLISNHSHSTQTGLGVGIFTTNGTDLRVSFSAGTGSSRTHSDYYGKTNVKNAWHHICIAFNSAEKKIYLYVNGKQDRDPVSYNLACTSDYFDIFNWSTAHVSNGAYRPTCRICDVRVYDHFLSQKELYEISKALVLHYTFENTNSNGFLNDSSGLGHHGSLSNASKYSYTTSTRLGTNALVSLSGDASAKINTTMNPSFINGSGTFCFWYKKDSSANNYNGAQFLVATQMSSGAYLFATGGTSPWSDKTRFSTWFIDGVEKANTTITDTNWHFWVITGVNLSDWSSLSMHAHGDTSWLYRGTIADFRIYNTIFDSTKVQELYRSTCGVNPQSKIFSNSFSEGGSKFESLKTDTVGVKEIWEPGVLPSTYIPLQYIETDGNAYIDTKYAPSTPYQIDCDMEISNSSVANYWFGQTQANGGMMYNGLYNNAALEFNWLTVGRTANNRCVMGQDLYPNGTLSIVMNGVRSVVAAGSNGSTGNFYIFACNNGSRPFGAKLKLYYFRIHTGTTDVRNFVPAKRKSDGVLGLFDLTNMQFYTNAGSGSFIAGPIAGSIAKTGNVCFSEFIEK